MRGDGGIWSQESGEGPLVVLVHGAMDRSGGMLRVRRELIADHRVCRYDRRGYGRSLAAGVSPSFDRQVEDLAGVVGGRPAVVVGHSFGGVVALALADRRPDLVRAVMAYEAPRTWESWWTGPGAEVLSRHADPTRALSETEAGDAAEWMLRRLIGDAVWERMPAGMRAERRAEGHAFMADMRSVRPPAPPPYDPAAITVPVVAAHGSQARAHHRRATGELARAAPSGELATIDGAGHAAHLTHPAPFARLVRRTVALAAERES
ncbi:MAG TPA: alpha/beta hydrolase [Acidimicrobiales bacterium]|nr:alpha/beta hydrolase [Acidimicrobiales bacterium]